MFLSDRRYVISADARLDENVIKKINEKKGEVYFDTFLSLEDLECEVKDLDKEQYFEDLSEDHAEGIRDRIERIIEQEPKKWVLENIWERIELPVEKTDTIIYSGIIATRIFSALELYGHSMENLEEAMDMVALISATIYQAIRQGYVESHVQNSSYQHITKEGRIFNTHIEGGQRSDMLICREEVTAFDAISPYGKKALFYPKLKQKAANINGYHSTEPRFMAALFAYAHQIGISSQITKSLCEEFSAELQKSDVYRRPNEEKSFELDCLRLVKRPLGKIDAKDMQAGPTAHEIFVEGGERAYGLYVGPKKELVFTHLRTGSTQEKKKEVVMRVYPEELIALLRSLIMHVAQGRSRTLPRTMESVLLEFINIL